ncbi:MAG: AraC family transcriptional regulator [Planctomycetota bacterium]
MEPPTENLTLVFPHLPGWDRGGGSLDPARTRTPRLIHAAWRHQAPRNARRAEHVHDVYHVSLVHAGRGSMIVNHERIDTQPGSLALISPGEPHTYATLPSDESVYSEVTFEVLDRSGRPVQTPFHDLLSAWSGLTVPRWTAGSIPPPALQNIIANGLSRVASACQSTGERRSFDVNRALMGLLETLIDLSREAAPPNDPALAAMRLIEHNLNRGITVQRIASEVNLSPNQLIKRFRQRYGVTPLAYRQQLRVDAAKRLLESTHYPIKTIASSVGFKDVFYFTRVFSSRVGRPPNAYRKLKRQESGL